MPQEPSGAPGPPDAGPAAPPAPPVLAPVQIDTGRIVAVGTAAFALVAVALLIARLVGADWALDHPTWLATAFAGAVLGLLGLTVIGRHRRLGRTK